MGASHLQPLLHQHSVALRAPSQWWSSPAGAIGEDGTAGDAGASVDGVYFGDIRVLDGFRVEITPLAIPDAPPASPEHIATWEDAADAVRFVSVVRALDGAGADPDVRMIQTVRMRPDGADVEFGVRSRLREPRPVRIRVFVRPDSSRMDFVKAGFRVQDRPALRVVGSAAVWTSDDVEVRAAPAAGLAGAGAVPRTGSGELVWEFEDAVPASGVLRFGLGVIASGGLPVIADEGPVPWRAPWKPAPSAGSAVVHPGPAGHRLRRWVDRALSDLGALRLQLPELTGETFIAAGAPWFFTLFGRDSIWAARLLLPLGAGLAASTLRVLASLQGEGIDPDSAEQPGKILHELRGRTLEIPEEGVSLPPRYYGTIDATPLWIVLLADAAEAGMPEPEVRALLPNLRAALAWMRDFGDADGDGLLEYLDETGRGLANQGWKDSGDSVQWADGRLAEGPIALVEVQAYAYEAAIRGGALLDRYEQGAGDEWRAWAAGLRDAFQAFWIEDADGPYPAIALDVHKRPVDSLTSNLGHLLGTGILDADQARAVASRLVSPELDSGFGLRTLSTRDAGYWPLSYHGGTVWPHDTAIAVRGLLREGFADEARTLANGLLAASPAFEYRMPELYSGDAIGFAGAPTPYPAACRPQAWSAAAAVTVLQALEPDSL